MVIVELQSRFEPASRHHLQEMRPVARQLLWSSFERGPSSTNDSVRLHDRRGILCQMLVSRWSHGEHRAMQKVSCQQVINQQAKCATRLSIMFVGYSCHVLPHPCSFAHARDHAYRHCVSRFNTSRHCQQLHDASNMLLVSCIHAKGHVSRFSNQQT